MVPLGDEGDRVRVHTVTEGDLTPYRLAVEQSRSRLSRWNPVHPDDLAMHLRGQSDRHRTFLVHARRPTGRHGVVGKVNVTSVVRGRLASGSLGYDAYDPYAGAGLFAEGMRLVIGRAFADQPQGMGLHRVEANVQPGNVASAGLLRSLGFRREGHSPRLMWLTGPDGQEAWRDHDTYAITREEWPADPYAVAAPSRVVCLVSGAPASGRAALARRLATELAVPLLSGDVVPPAALWPLLADSVAGGVVDGGFSGPDAGAAGEGLARAGVRADSVPEVWCGSSERRGADGSGPLGVGPLLQVDASVAVPAREVTRLALAVRSSAG